MSGAHIPPPPPYEFESIKQRRLYLLGRRIGDMQKRDAERAALGSAGSSG